MLKKVNKVKLNKQDASMLREVFSDLLGIKDIVRKATEQYGEVEAKVNKLVWWFARKYKADEKLGVELDRIQFDPVNNCFIERKDEVSGSEN